MKWDETWYDIVRSYRYSADMYNLILDDMITHYVLTSERSILPKVDSLDNDACSIVDSPPAGKSIEGHAKTCKADGPSIQPGEMHYDEAR